MFQHEWGKYAQRACHLRFFAYNTVASRVPFPGVTMLADGEPAFIGLFVIFAILVFLGIGANMGWIGVVY